MPRFQGFLRQFDWLLLLSVVALVALGMAAIYSVALSQESADFIFVKKQFIALGLGLLIFGVFTFSNYRFLGSYSTVLYIIGIVLLIAVLIWGTTVRGTTGWFQMFGFSFQPVEIVKVFMIVVMAKYFSERARKRIGLREIFESGALATLPMILVLLQPDLGSALVLFAIWAVALVISGVRKSHLLMLGVGFIAVFILFWTLLFADYQKARLLSFVDPSLDPLGQGYNVTQAIIAVGSGEIFGRGLGFGSQSQLKFLPEAQTDFIFAVIAEELGFLGIILVLAAFTLLFARILRLSRIAHDNFTCYLLIGIGSVFFFQFLVNIGMNLGLMPVTGIALPFVSYGGSSLLIALLLLGVVESITLRTSNVRSRHNL
ncbi:MAG: rod shape-determining protein RodA [Candidatus Uhrbacteria bacterium]|nr:rod shape-determining protein RodA [Patescibacteria group bacterium]MBU1907301.1 rod shape-determining protein RodA [Patescibacteria group bacterium]